VLNSNGFKVTSEPSFGADRVDLKIKGGTVKVFLKKYPRIFNVTMSREFHVPYNFWSANVEFGFLKPSPTPDPWKVSGQFDIRNKFSSFNLPLGGSPTPEILSYTRYWQSLVSALPGFTSQVSSDKAAWLIEADNYYAALQADSSVSGLGYIWFNLAYTWTSAQRLAVDRFYSAIAHSFFLWNGQGQVFSRFWRYQGEFVGGVEYNGRKYYIWRYTSGGVSTHIDGSLIYAFEMSNAAWELEPRSIVLDEIGNFTSLTADMHYVNDSRPQFIFIGDPLFANLDFQGTLGKIVDLSAAPLQYQT
jgi:hypothetical protein